MLTVFRKALSQGWWWSGDQNGPGRGNAEGSTQIEAFQPVQLPMVHCGRLSVAPHQQNHTEEETLLLEDAESFVNHTPMSCNTVQNSGHLHHI